MKRDLLVPDREAETDADKETNGAHGEEKEDEVMEPNGAEKEDTPTEATPKFNFRYAQIPRMRPSDLLETEFLTECIKKGDVIMRSQGRSFEDTIFILEKG